MATHANLLSEDPASAPQLAALQGQITEFAKALNALQSSLQETRDELKVVRIERDLLKERVRAFERTLYAAKNEARGTHQRDLFFNEAETLAPASETPKVRVPAHERARRGRKPLDPALPREVIRYELPEAERVCPHDGAALKAIGVEASEQLDIIPAQVRVIRHERVKYACPCCAQGVRTAALPPKLLPKSLLTESSLAWVISAKYQDALPLYRQAAILARCGGEIARNTLAHNVVRVGMAVTPIINLLRDHLLDARLLYGDETELQVLKEDGRPAQSKSYLWVQVAGTGPPVRLFTYAPSRSAKTALDLYAGVAKGAALMSDGYEVYASVAAANGLPHLGCWAHARRKFIEAEAALPKGGRTPAHPASQVLALIGALYGCEAQADELKVTVAGRHQQRQTISVPLLAQIEALLLANLHSVLPQSLLGRALHYLHAQWPKLTRFVDDGHHPLDNNVAENAIRPFVIGRKNWLFSDSVGGAHASANLYTLIETAKANGVEPYRYLRQLFQALPTAQSVDDFEALLPWNIKLPA